MSLQPAETNLTAKALTPTLLQNYMDRVAKATGHAARYLRRSSAYDDYAAIAFQVVNGHDVTAVTEQIRVVTVAWSTEMGWTYFTVNRHPDNRVHVALANESMIKSTGVPF